MLPLSSQPCIAFNAKAGGWARQREIRARKLQVLKENENLTSPLYYDIVLYEIVVLERSPLRNPRVVYLHASLTRFTPIVSELLGKVTPEQATQRLHSDTNSLHWIAAHLTLARSLLAELCGAGVELPGWRQKFGRGVKPEAPSAFLKISEIKSRWDEMSPALLAGLAEITDTRLNAPKPPDLSMPGESVGDVIGLLCVHEGYHVGQLGLFQKAIWGEGFFD